MSWRILSACGWERINGSSPAPNGGSKKVSFVQQRSGVDGGFLLVHLIADHLRAGANNRVLLFAAQQTATHYIAACQKVGFNAANFIGSGQLQIVDVLEELLAQCGKPVELDLSHHSAADHVGRQLFALLRERTHKVTDTESNSIIILDDLSFYTIIDRTSGEDSMIDFVEELIALPGTRASHIVLKVNVGECYERLGAFLSDMATIDIRLEPLQSGNFREVDGRLTVHERKSVPEGPLLVPKQLRCNLLYKVGDRQVQTFVPGEFGIKNL